MRLKKQVILIGFYILMIVLIGFADWLSGFRLAFSIFYIIPVIFLASRKGVSRGIAIVGSVLAGFTWHISDTYLNTFYITTCFPIWNGFVRLMIFLIVALIVNSLRKEQELLKKYNKKLKFLNEEKNKSLGVAAHDLMTPLAAIHSFSEFLLNDKELIRISKNKKDILIKINNTSKNAIDLVKNMLDISKIDAGNINLDILTHDYVEFVRQEIALSQIIASYKGIKITLYANQDTIPAEFDKLYMREVIDNLISNAIKYSDANSEILVRLSKTDSTITTEVIDTGVGIAENELDKLFKPFARSSARTTSGEKATGLGLATIKKVVEEHNGKVGVKSQLGKGSTFYFTFPAKGLRVKPVHHETSQI